MTPEQQNEESAQTLLAILKFAVVGLGLLALLVVLMGSAHAETAIQIAEDESIRGGIDAVWAGIGALLVGIAGWLAKRPQDVIRERREGTDENPSTAQLAFDSIRAHEIACEEYRKEQREEIRRIHGRIDEGNRTMAEISANVAYLRGKADGTG